MPTRGGQPCKNCIAGTCPARNDKGTPAKATGPANSLPGTVRRHRAKVPDYRGLFLRGYGQQTYTQNNGSMVGNTATTHASGELGKVQGDAIRDPGSSSVTYLHSGSGGMSCEGPMCDGFKTVQTRGDQWAGSWPMNSPGLNPLKGLQQPFGNEIRPVNTAVRYFIRARP